MIPASRTEIRSGGQTGVDRAALDAAIDAGIVRGGWCPAGRRAEDGPIPALSAHRDRKPELRRPHPPQRPRFGRDPDRSADEVVGWIAERGVSILNVAGPRESTIPGIYGAARPFLDRLLARLADPA